jgi:hypothetical protein
MSQPKSAMQAEVTSMTGEKRNIFKNGGNKQALCVKS